MHHSIYVLFNTSQLSFDFKHGFMMKNVYDFGFCGRLMSISPIKPVNKLELP